MEFADLLAARGIAPGDTALCLHKGAASRWRLSLAGLLDTEPELFEAYQRTHSRIAEATLKKRGRMASFLGTGTGELRFVGLYDVAGWEERTAEALDADPAMARMRAHTGHESFTAAGRGRALFDLVPDGGWADLAGRLVAVDPGGRAYMRLAETTPLAVAEIARERSFAGPLPAWDTLILSAEQLNALPRDWALGLARWRGVYLVTDEGDGQRYVGSAYGAENLLGRWRAHVAGDRGVTVGLAERDPSRFRFSILQLLAESAPAEEVIAVEQTWMDRLHTVRFGLNRPGADKPAGDA